MKTSRKTLLLSFLMLISTFVFAQTTDKVVDGFKIGNADMISAYFSNNIEFFVNNSDNIYTKSQAGSILMEFFRLNKPQGFTILHQGTKNMSQFVIGKLETSEKNYRIYFLIKDNVVQQLRIENYDE